METVLGILFSLQTVIFCLVIAFAVLVLRRVTEAFAKKVAKIFPDKWEPWWILSWRDWILPGLPFLLGGLAGWLIPSYPYPEALATTVVARVFFGLVAGGFSGYVYRSAKSLLSKVLPEKQAEQVKEVLNKVDNNG